MAATRLSVLWAVISCVASISSAVGYYFPYWLEGFYITETGEIEFMYFGVFRRCSYLQAGNDDSVGAVTGCDRYSEFVDIPSVSWQISTILIGVGACLSILLSLSSLATLCLKNIVTVFLARTAGLLQLSAGLLIIFGAVIYPTGWDITQVLQACGDKAGIYNLGHCSLKWAFYLTAGGGVLTTFCSILTCQAFKQKFYWTSYDV